MGETETQKGELISQYLNTISPNDKFLGQNVQFPNALGYVTPAGVFKSYGKDNVVFSGWTQDAQQNGV